MIAVHRRAFFYQVSALRSFLSAAEPKRKVLISGGHPGDPEYGCGGTVAKLVRGGYDVMLLYLNRGEKGCETDQAACGTRREREASEACRILGAKPLFFREVDGEAVVDAPAYADFAALIAQHQPELIFSQWPIDNHRDHRAIAMLTYDAWLPIRDKCCLYYYEVTDGEDTVMFAPTDYVDISMDEPTKRKACYAHASQAPDHFYKVQSDIAVFRGMQVGFKQAEAFVRDARSKPHSFPGA